MNNDLHENDLIKVIIGLQKVNQQITITNKLLQAIDHILIPYRKKDKWGFCTPDKKIIIDCIYDEVDQFSKGLATFQLNGRWGCLDKNGSHVIACVYYDSIEYCEGLAEVKMNDEPPLSQRYDNYNFINRDGTLLSKDGYIETCHFSEGHAYVKQKKDDHYYQHGFINNLGQMTIDLGGMRYAKPFSEGMAEVQIGEYWGYINENGKRIIPCHNFKSTAFSEGVAAVCRFSKFKHESNGRVYEYVDPIIEFEMDLGVKIIANLPNGSFIKEWGYIDKEGQDVIPFKYDFASPFSDGLANTKLDNAWGYIDVKGNQIIPFLYDMAKPFSEGLAATKFKGKWGYIDKLGNQIIPCLYENAASFSEGLAGVVLNGKLGYINKLGDQIVPNIYEIYNNYTLDYSLFSNGLSCIAQNAMGSKSGYIDKNGTEFWED